MLPEKISAKSVHWFWRRSRLNIFIMYGHNGHLEFQNLTILATFGIYAKYEIL